MSKYLVKYDEWTEVSEQTGTIQNIDDGCPIEVSTTQVAGSGVILYPWEMKQFSNVQLYVRGYNKNPLPTEVRVVPFEIGQGGSGGSYVLPTATATRLGGVKIGQGITVAEDGTISGIDTWADDTPYHVGIYVTYNDDLYLCTTAHTSGSTFDSSKWKKIGGIDAWKTNTDYVPGDYVTYKNKLYLCITAHTSSTKFAPTKWQEIGELPIATATTLGGVKIGQGINVAADGTISGTAEWETATEYDVGNYVTFYNYGRQEWQDDTAYSAGDFVTNDGYLYKCIVSHTAGSIFADDLVANKWAQVPLEGGLYICVKAHTSDDFHDDFIVGGKWNAIRNGIDFWSTTKHYEIGQYVTVPDDYKRDEWQANTAYSIGDIVKVYNRGKSEWATGTSYAIGDYATMGKALYRCGTAHTSTTFADDVAAGDWTLVDTIVEQFSALENHTSGSSFPADFGAGKWKSKTSHMETCICLLEHISDDFAANFVAGKWQEICESAKVMAGATSSANGASGLVPAPSAGDDDKVLFGNGTWADLQTEPDMINGWARKESTAYAVGDVVRISALDVNKKLVCVKAGTSASGNISLASTQEGVLVTDGTVTWQVDSFADGNYSAEHGNGIYRGADVTAYFESGLLSTNIAAGKFVGVHIGDFITKTINLPAITYTDKAGTEKTQAAQTFANAKFYIAGINSHRRAGDGSGTTVNHVVLISTTALQRNVSMNPTDDTTGGYIGSDMWRIHMPNWSAAIKAAFGESHVLKHREILSNTLNATAASAAGGGWMGATTNWAWTDVEVNIPNETMIYGCHPHSSSRNDVGDWPQQLPLFAHKQYIGGDDRSWFWLRAVASESRFAYVDGYGNADAVFAWFATDYVGIRPVFLLC